MESRSEALKTIGSVCALVVISLLLLLGLSPLFQPKDTSKEAGMIDASANAIMAEPAGTIDVLFIGDSEAYSSISPLQLWGEHGITSYVCSSAGTRLPYANQLLRRATQNQQPRVVVIETNMFFTLFSIDDLVTKELEGLLPIVRFHDRWKSFTSENPFGASAYTWTDDLKGFRINKSIVPADAESLVHKKEVTGFLNPVNRAYFEEMIGYCRSIDATPVLFTAPNLTNWSQQRHDAVQKLADQIGVEYLDFNVAPYEVDISKLSKASGISRQSTLKYLTNMEEANLIRRVFTNLMTVTDLQKPDKIYLDNPNLLYTLSLEKPEIGTVRETFFANQLASAGHKVEYAGYKKGDFRIDGDIVIEVGGQDKGFSQVANHENAYVAADDIESAYMRKIPLWAFGFLY